MSVEVNTYGCVYDAGTGPLKIEIIRDDNDCDTKEGTTSVPTSARCSEYSEESVAYHLFKRFHKRLDHLLPSHFPDKPSSFQAYLTSVFQDPSNFVVERAEIHSSSAKASTYRDDQTRAFLAATFPPIRVGSLAGEVTGISVKGDNFPQFTHLTKGNFKIPYVSHVCSRQLEITNHIQSRESNR